ncbi:unnamed protein product [Ilex paraguariensis]|uniref:RNase H type-1 domain-containing protein n=1 Tax=Ilex paraguariensis TaxID=185542 RepID=A0ABC8TCE3_9AQUA
MVSEITSCQISYFDKQDVRVWMPTSTGKFSIESARSTARQHGLFSFNCCSYLEAAADGVLKLNVDGSAKGCPGWSGGGAVLHNQSGQLILAASKFYGVGTNMAAEIRGLGGWVAIIS